MRIALFVTVLLLGSVLFAQEQEQSTPAEQNPQTQGNQTEPQNPPEDAAPVPDYTGDTGQGPLIGNPDDAQAPPPVNFMGSMLRAVGSLLIVLGLVLGLSWLAKRFLPQGLGGGKPGDVMRLVQTLPLGPKRYAALVEVEGRRFLLGVTDNQINLLKDLTEINFQDEVSQAAMPRTVREMLEEGP